MRPWCHKAGRRLAAEGYTVFRLCVKGDHKELHAMDNITPRFFQSIQMKEICGYGCFNILAQVFKLPFK